MLKKYGRLFRNELGCFNDGVTISIPFMDEKDVGDLKQNPFGLSRRDRKAFD